MMLPKLSSSRMYYSISEVCKLTKIRPHVLRYWESEFKELKPRKNRAGNRVYKKDEIKTIILIKHLLYDERYTIEGAKKYLADANNNKDAKKKLENELIELKTFLTTIKSDLEDLANILS